MDTDMIAVFTPVSCLELLNGSYLNWYLDYMLQGRRQI